MSLSRGKTSCANSPQPFVQVMVRAHADARHRARTVFGARVSHGPAPQLRVGYVLGCGSMAPQLRVGYVLGCGSAGTMADPWQCDPRRVYDRHACVRGYASLVWKPAGSDAMQSQKRSRTTPGDNTPKTPTGQRTQPMAEENWVRTFKRAGKARSTAPCLFCCAFNHLPCTTLGRAALHAGVF